MMSEILPVSIGLAVGIFFLLFISSIPAPNPLRLNISEKQAIAIAEQAAGINPTNQSNIVPTNITGIIVARDDLYFIDFNYYLLNVNFPKYNSTGIIETNQYGIEKRQYLPSNTYYWDVHIEENFDNETSMHYQGQRQMTITIGYNYLINGYNGRIERVGNIDSGLRPAIPSIGELVPIADNLKDTSIIRQASMLDEAKLFFAYPKDQMYIGMTRNASMGMVEFSSYKVYGAPMITYSMDIIIDNTTGKSNGKVILECSNSNGQSHSFAYHMPAVNQVKSMLTSNVCQ